MNQNVIIGQGHGELKCSVPPSGEVFEQAAALNEALSKTADLASILIDRLEPVLIPRPEGDSCGGKPSQLRSTRVGQELQAMTMRADSIAERLNAALSRLALP